MFLIIIMVGCGIYALSRNKLVIFRNRVVQGEDSRIVGIILIVGAILGFFINGASLLALLAAIVYGLVKAKPVSA